MAMLNMEGEGIEPIREYFRKKLVRIGVIDPTEDDKAEMQAMAQNQPQDPNATYLQAAAEEAMAKASQARASVIKTVADAELTKAKTIETLGKVDASSQDQALKMVGVLGGALSQPEQIQQPNIAPPM